MRKHVSPQALALVCCCIVSGCGGGSSAASVVANPLPTVTATTAPTTPQIVGYWDDWQQTSWSQVPQGVTTLIVAFDFVSGHTVVSDGNSPGGLVPENRATDS